jgi:hypothetical protein
MGLAGLLVLSTADSGMPTVTAARPFRWGWRCLGEQRAKLLSNLRAFSGLTKNPYVYLAFHVLRALRSVALVFRNANRAAFLSFREARKSNARLAFREMRQASFGSRMVL